MFSKLTTTLATTRKQFLPIILPLRFLHCNMASPNTLNRKTRLQSHAECNSDAAKEIKTLLFICNFGCKV